MKQKLTQAEKREQRWAYLMIAPTILGLLILNYYPLLDTIRLPEEKRIAKIKALSVAPVLAEAIARIYSDKPVSTLFN